MFKVSNQQIIPDENPIPNSFDPNTHFYILLKAAERPTEKANAVLNQGRSNRESYTRNQLCPLIE
jgi:hypothetical protein